MSAIVNYFANVKPLVNIAEFRVVPPVRCADGFEMSVQASASHYCTPRNSSGPWTHYEVGFPNEVEELLMDYAEDAEDPTDTVYGWVPEAVINEVIEKHGGIVNA